MYTEAFGLTAEPFAPTPDPAFLFSTPQHREALAALEYGLRERRGFVTLVGEVGTGKTTVVYTLMENLSGAFDTAFLTHTTLEYDDLLRAALVDLGVAKPGHTKGELVATLNRFLHDQSDRGRITALVIDEAQNLSLAALEELRLLTDYETFEHKLLQIVLIGQPELDDRLSDPKVRQFRDRIAVRARLAPLRSSEVAEYIDHRLRVAGSSAKALFTKSAIAAIGRWAQGNPRRINTLCHNSLLAAFARRERKVGRRLVRIAIDELEALSEPRSLLDWYRRAWRGLRRRSGGGASESRWPSRQPRRRYAAIAVATLLLVAAAGTVQIAKTDPTSSVQEGTQILLSAKHSGEPERRLPATLRAAAYRVLDAILPQEDYLEWERRRHGYRE